MATSRYRPLKPVEFVALAELVLEDLRVDRGETKPPEAMSEEDAASYMGSLGIDEITKLCQPMPVGQALGELMSMGLIERPKKSNGREITTRVRATQQGEDAVLRELPKAIARFTTEAKAVKAVEGDEIKARKTEWQGRLKRVAEAAAALGEALELAEATSPAGPKS